MGKRGNWMERLTEGLDAAEVATPGQPLVEICGERRVLIEHHRGVSRYGRDLICVRVRYGEVALRGSGLELANMTRDQLVVCGKIHSVTLIRRDCP